MECFECHIRREDVFWCDACAYCVCSQCDQVPTVFVSWLEISGEDCLLCNDCSRKTG